MEGPEYVLMEMLAHLLSTGMQLVSQGVAELETVDSAWMHYRRAPMGPFAMMDLFGLNLIYDSWQYRAHDDAITAKLRTAVLALLQPFIDRGELGMKAGRGFYCYPEPTYQTADFIGNDSELAPVYEVLASAWIGNAVVIAALEVADPEDIDQAWMVGTFLDSGPFAVLAQIGQDEFLQMLARQVAAGRFDAAKATMIESYLYDSHNNGSAPGD